MRAVGVTAGAMEPDFAICPRFSMYCSVSRSDSASQGRCSPSRMTPSYFEACSSIAMSMLHGANSEKAHCPLSRARMRPLRRGNEDKSISLSESSDFSAGLAALGEKLVQARIDAARITFEDLVTVRFAQTFHLIDVFLGVVVIVAGVGIDAAHRTDHFRGKEDIVNGDDLGQQLDARQVIHAGIEKDIVEQVLGKRRPLHILRQPAIAAPMIRHRAAAMRNDELQRREILEQIALDEL